MAKKLPEEKILMITTLLRKGENYRSIAEKLNCSVVTITRIASITGITKEKTSGSEAYVRKWLLENWHWDIPKKKEQPRMKKRTLITPYHYPAMYSAEQLNEWEDRI